LLVSLRDKSLTLAVPWQRYSFVLLEATHPSYGTSGPQLFCSEHQR
jgi:hypothetical protein